MPIRNKAVITICFLACTVGCHSEEALALAHRAATVASIRAIHLAETQYYAQYGKFAASLAELGPPAGLIPADLATGEKAGYKYVLERTAEGYTVHANPVTAGAGSGWPLFSDQSLTIREHRGPEPASLADPDIEAK